jgi:hypothetical protein
MKTILHVNQHEISKNKKQDLNNPILICRKGVEYFYGHEAIIYGQDGLEAARIRYAPKNTLPSGGNVWIETDNKVDIINK